METGRSLVGERRPEEGCLIESLADELQSDGESLVVEPARNADTREPGDVDRDGADVGQVHREGVVDPGTHLERHGWRDR